MNVITNALIVIASLEYYTNQCIYFQAVGRSLIPVEVLHVTFFADCGRRAWLLSNFLMKFEGQEHFHKTREEFTPEVRMVPLIVPLATSTKSILKLSIKQDLSPTISISAFQEIIDFLIFR